MNDNIHGVFVEADGDYYGPFPTHNAANAFARTRIDARVCVLDLHYVSSREITPEEYLRERDKLPQLIDPSTV